MQSINLLSQEYRSNQKRRVYKSVIGVGLAIELGISGAIGLLPIRNLQNQTKEIEILEEKVAHSRFDEVKAVHEDLEKTEQDYDEWLSRLSQLEGQEKISIALMDTLISNVPIGVTIDYLEVKSKRIELKGKAVNSFSARGYFSKIQSLYKDAAIIFKVSERDREKKYHTFDMLIDLEDMRDKEGIKDDKELQ